MHACIHPFMYTVYTSKHLHACMHARPHMHAADWHGRGSSPQSSVQGLSWFKSGDKLQKLSRRDKFKHLHSTTIDTATFCHTTFLKDTVAFWFYEHYITLTCRCNQLLLCQKAYISWEQNFSLVHHTPVRNSSDTRTPVSVTRNQLPPLCTVLVPFWVIFEAGFRSLQVVAGVVDPP